MKTSILLAIVLLLIPGCTSTPVSLADPPCGLKVAQRQAEFVLECAALRVETKDEHWLELCQETASKTFCPGG